MIKFTKMQGLGNDYVYIDCTKNINQITNVSYLAKIMSNRHFGIGSDGLILICKSDVADFKMRMFNSDGTEAEMCGNGIRCLGKFVYDKGLTKEKKIMIETLAGIKKLELYVENEKVTRVKVDMGIPILTPMLIPVLANKEPVNNLKIQVDDKNFVFTCVSMGNPHAVTIVDSLDNFNIQKYGPILENDVHFPKKSNIEFIEITDKENINMRVWERGAGETLACGTGACAATVASVLNNLVNNKINVKLLGGTLEIEWNEKNSHVYMTGNAESVFEGEFNEGGLEK